MKKTIACLLFIYNSSFCAAQTATISGTVINRDENTAVHNAVISLLSPFDSTIYSFTRSDASGKFILRNITPGKYIMMTSQPWFGDLLDNITIESDMEIPDIQLLSKAALLQEVIVNTGTPMRIKGDTTIYTADSFAVSANANVEELLKKLPGIQVDKDGKITALGETVQKVLVDGEEFFGDDPGMAVKNLRADAVKEVQVFDKKSEQAEFTGIDDGNTQKTINLKLKEDAKKGFFGKMDVAGGPVKNIDNRYNTNLMGSSFKGKRKISAFLLNGNTGQDGLGWEDEQKYGGFDNITVNDDGGVMIMMGGSSDGEPYVDTRNGFMTNTNAGIQYSNKWKDVYNLNLAPRYNQQQYENNRKSFLQTPVEDSIFTTNSHETSDINRHNIKIKGILDIKIDSMNSLKITANNNFYQTESNTREFSETTGNEGTLKNSSTRETNTRSDKHAFSGNILFKHKFKKDRRTLAVSANWGLIKSDGKTFLLANNKSYFEGKPASGRLQDQMKSYTQSTNNSNASITYTEPLGKNYSLELNYNLQLNQGKNDQFVHAPNGTGNYVNKIDTLSNEFSQTILQNIPGTKINFSTKKLKANIGAAFGFTNFELEDKTFQKDYNRDYVNFYPSANITYTYKANSSIRFNYDGSSRQPTINQLQPLRNSDNYFYQVLGNPDLKPTFNNSIRLNHSTYNFLKDFWSYQSLNISFTNNQIVNNRIIDLDSGKTITRPENMKGGYYVNFYSNASFKIKKADLGLGFGPNFSLFESPIMINNKKTFSKGFSPGLSIFLQKAKEKRYMFFLDNTIGYTNNSTMTNADTKLTTSYFTNRANAELTFYYKKVWQITTSYVNNYQGKTIQSDKSLQINILNARLQRTFKNDQFTIYLSGNDLLNQNEGIDRNYSNGNYSEVINDRLKRYFLLGFRWDFKNKSANANK
jgi:hypothetical protein